MTGTSLLLSPPPPWVASQPRGVGLPPGRSKESGLGKVSCQESTLTMRRKTGSRITDPPIGGSENQFIIFYLSPSKRSLLFFPVDWGMGEIKRAGAGEKGNERAPFPSSPARLRFFNSPVFSLFAPSSRRFSAEGASAEERDFLSRTKH